jgi:hypothetical protein
LTNQVFYCITAFSGVIRPYADASDDLGNGAFRFGNGYIKGLLSIGWLNVGGFGVIDASRNLSKH